MAARRSSVMTRVSLIPPSCTVCGHGSPPAAVCVGLWRLLPRGGGVGGGWGALRVPGRLAAVGLAHYPLDGLGRDRAQIYPPLLFRLLKFERGGARRGLGLTRLAGTRGAAPAPVDEQ